MGKGLHLAACSLAAVLVALLSCDVGHAQNCRQAQFKGHVNGGEKFQQKLTPQLEFELIPLAQNHGWEIRIGPAGSEEDWAWAVNPPYHAGNSQNMGTGWGDSVRYQLGHPHLVWFLASKAENDRMNAAVELALSGKSNSDEFRAALQAARKYFVTVNARDYDKQGSEEQAAWMDFEATVTVPEDFPGSDKLKWIPAVCPDVKR